MTAPAPHNPSNTRRAARLQRERDAERAAEPPAMPGALPRTMPLPVVAVTTPATAAHDGVGTEPAIPPVHARRRRRPATGPTPTRVGARGAAGAPTRRAAKTAQLMGPSALPARHARVRRPPRARIVGALAVLASLVLGSSATVTAALSGDAVTEVAQPRTAPVVAPPIDREPSVERAVPMPAPVEALPTPTIEAAPAALALCSTPAFLAALSAGDDAGAIAAAGGAAAFRAAVASGAAPCVALDDPARLWVVLNKTRPIAPLDHRPPVEPPIGMRSIEGGALRPDAAAALSAMAAASVAAGAGEIALQSGFRSYETQQSTYGNQVDAQGGELADQTSARPGFSEHQSGLAGDVVACADGCGSLDDLALTTQGQWIAAHAWEYGWITRYEDGYAPITGYSPEPWHLRYIGPELARAYHDGGWHTLEEFFGLPAAPTYL